MIDKSFLSWEIRYFTLFYGTFLSFFYIGPTLASLFIYFRSFQTNITIFTTNICENVHPVYGAGIRAHDLWNMSLLPLPLHQGSRPYEHFFKSFCFCITQLQSPIMVTSSLMIVAKMFPMAQYAPTYWQHLRFLPSFSLVESYIHWTRHFANIFGAVH